MKRIIAFIIALTMCVGLYVPFATSTQTRAAGTPTISVDSTEITVGESLTVYVGNTEGVYHGGKVVYSVRTLKDGKQVNSINVSDGNAFTKEQVTFEDLAGGTYTVQLRVWDANDNDGDQFTVLQEITVTVKQPRPTISIKDTDLTAGDTLHVYVDDSTGNVHNGDAYSIQISGPTTASKDISNGSAFTYTGESVDFDGLKAGTYTVNLRYWNQSEGVVVLQTLTVDVAKARPTISIENTELTEGDSLIVSVGNTAGVTDFNTEAYSVRIVGGTSVNISNSSGFTKEQVTFEDLAAGTYTVQLRLWTEATDFTTLQEITVTVAEKQQLYPTISIKDADLTAGDTLQVYVDDSAGDVHDNKVYSIKISGPTTATKTISDGSKFTYTGESVDFDGLQAGTYTVTLLYWKNGMDSTATLQTLTVDVAKARPTISIENTELTEGDSLTVSVGNTTAVTDFNTEAYSVRIVGGTSVNISNSSGFTKEQVTFEDLAAGTYTVQLRLWDAKITEGDQNSTLQEITVTVNAKPLAISVSKDTLKAGESITISYEGLRDSLLTSNEVYSIWFGTPDGGRLNEWSIWNTSTSMGESNSFTIYVQSAGTYVVRLRIWNADTGALEVLKEIFVTVEKAVQLGGSIQAGKSEYIAGEVQYFSYTFEDAADVTNIGHRSIKIYNGSKLVFEWTSRDNANSGSSSNEWLTLTNASFAGTPGTYTMKVVIYGTDIAYPGYEDMTYTYTVVERAEGTTPDQPTISVPKTTLLSNEQIAIAFDGMSIAALDTNTRYRIAVRNAQGTLLDSWVLWDCGNTYEGLYGMKYSQALPIGDYTVALETRPNSSGDYAAIDTIEILVKKASLTAQPDLKESITMHYTVTLGSDITGTPVMKFVYNGQEKEVTGTSVGNNAYTFPLEGILPQDMGKTIDAYVSVDGTQVVYYEGYSMRAYCLRQLETTDDANLKALLVALLNYGTQAQNCFGSDDSAVNEGLDQSILNDYLAGKNYDASNPEGYVASPVDKESNKGEYVWTAAALGLFDTIKIRVKFEAASIDGLKVVVNGTDEYTEFVHIRDNKWYVYIPVFAADFAQELSITFQNSEGTVGGTLTYSVNTYIGYAMTSNAIEQDVKDLVESIYYYGVLAAERK